LADIVASAGAGSTPEELDRFCRERLGRRAVVNWCWAVAGNARRTSKKRGADVTDSVYRVTQVIGTSSESWAAAARTAVETAAKTVRDLRVAEVDRLDVTIDDGKISSFRVRLNISFKYETGD